MQRHSLSVPTGLVETTAKTVDHISIGIHTDDPERSFADQPINQTAIINSQNDTIAVTDMDLAEHTRCLRICRLSQGRPISRSPGERRGIHGGLTKTVDSPFPRDNKQFFIGRNHRCNRSLDTFRP